MPAKNNGPGQNPPTVMRFWPVFAALAALFAILTVTDPSWLRAITAVSFTCTAIAARHAAKENRR